MIQIQNLYKSFGRNKVLRGLSFELNRPGEITAILGPNGCGKTTLIKCILGMVIPDEGLIKVDGGSIEGQFSYRRLIDYLPQIGRFPENLTVVELIKLIKDIRGEKANDAELIKLFDLEGELNQRLVNLSGGTKQKVNLTLALMYDSPIVILDEPTSGLDPLAMVNLRALINREKERGKIIVITTHIMSFVEELADEIIFLQDGQLFFRGSVEGLLSEYEEKNVERAIAVLLKNGGTKGEDVTSLNSSVAEINQI